MDFSYKKLIVWQKSLELTKQIYLLTESYPSQENFVLKQQMRRAAISISSNIAEGSGRTTIPDRKRFYTIARSSLIELDSQIETSKTLKYTTSEDSLIATSLQHEVFRILSKLIG